MSAEERLDKHLKLKNPLAYKGERHAWRRFLTEIWGPIKEGNWMSKKTKGSFPKITTDLTKSFGIWLLANYRKGTLEQSQAATNHFYQKAGQPPPWTGRSFARIMSAYKAARRELAIERGEKHAAGARTPVPEQCFKFLLSKAEGLPNGHPEVAEIAIIMTGFAYCLRASSLCFEKEDVYFTNAGELIVNSEVVKTESRAHKHSKRLPPGPRAAGTRHPRTRYLALMRRVVDNDHFYDCTGEPDETSTLVTAMMRKLIPDNVAMLPQGRTISSHSLRKASASALFAIAADFHRCIMPWGGWRSLTSAEKYVDRKYLATSWSGGFFDWFRASDSLFCWNKDNDE
jgi:hypothetical protein